MHDIFDRLFALRKNVEVAIFLLGGKWSVNLKYFEGDRYTPKTQLEIKEQGKDFEDTLRQAWVRFEAATTKGIGSHALMPPVETTVVDEDEILTSLKETL